MYSKKEIDTVVFEVTKVCDFRGRVKKNRGRKYEYFRNVMNRAKIDRNHQMIRMYKVVCKLGTIKGFEDVSIIPADIKYLVKAYNDDSNNKYEITYANETPNKPRYYLNYKETTNLVNPISTNSNSLPDCKEVKEGLNTSFKSLLDNKQLMIDGLNKSYSDNRDDWCVNWVINTILNKFKVLGFGNYFKAKDLVGKNHSFCERTKYYIDNHHIAEARRIINSNCKKYGFWISAKYTLYPIDPDRDCC